VYTLSLDTPRNYVMLPSISENLSENINLDSTCNELNFRKVDQSSLFNEISQSIKLLVHHPPKLTDFIHIPISYLALRDLVARGYFDCSYWQHSTLHNVEYCHVSMTHQLTHYQNYSFTHSHTLSFTPAFIVHKV